MMNAAPLHSPRLQKVLRALSEGRPLTTRQIARKAGVMAVNACVAELRHHGAEIDCRSRLVNGKRRFFYTLKKAPNP